MYFILNTFQKLFVWNINNFRYIQINCSLGYTFSASLITCEYPILLSTLEYFLISWVWACLSENFPFFHNKFSGGFNSFKLQNTPTQMPTHTLRHTLTDLHLHKRDLISYTIEQQEGDEQVLAIPKLCSVTFISLQHAHFRSSLQKSLLSLLAHHTTYHTARRRCTRTYKQWNQIFEERNLISPSRVLRQ